MPRFTAANARENAAKAHASRRLRLASGKPAGESFPQTPQGDPHEPANDYVSRRLARVREQLDRLDTMLLAEKDAQKLDRLDSAQLRLSEQERILAGRPLPGSRRPGKEGAGRKSDWWIEMQPTPPAPQVPKDGLPDLLPVEPPTPAPTATPTPRSAPSVAPVPIEVALRHRPASLPTPASPATPATPAPPSQKPG